MCFPVEPHYWHGFYVCGSVAFACCFARHPLSPSTIRGLKAFGVTYVCWRNGDRLQFYG